jgi:PIN domain nuclease of toxin-antitoxin system
VENHEDEVILLDTHVLIWLANEPAKLSKRASEAIRAAGQSGGLAISAITLWEVAWLATHGRLEFVGTVDDFVERISSRIAIRQITAKVAVLANQFPSTYSTDPCDRLIGATALAEGIALVTKNRTIRDCKQIKTIW